MSPAVRGIRRTIPEQCWIRKKELGTLASEIMLI